MGTSLLSSSAAGSPDAADGGADDGAPGGGAYENAGAATGSPPRLRVIRLSPSLSSTVLRLFCVMSLTSCSSRRTSIGPELASEEADAPAGGLPFFFLVSFLLNVASLKTPIEVG